MELNINKIKSYKVVKNKKKTDPLWGRKAKSIDQFKYDLDLIKNKLEMTRKNSFPRLLIMSVHDH